MISGHSKEAKEGSSVGSSTCTQHRLMRLTAPEQAQRGARAAAAEDDDRTIGMDASGGDGCH